MTCTRSVLAMLTIASAAACAAAEIITVSSPGDVSSAMQNADPGDVLVLDDGTYTDQLFRFVGNGDPGNPITLRAQTPGMVRLNGSSRLEIGGSHLVVEGLRFDGGSLSSGHVVRFQSGSTKAHHCVLRDTAIIDYNPGDVEVRYFWVSLVGTNNVVERCRFENQNHSGVVVCVWEDFPNDHIIRDNYFVDMPEDPEGANGWETIRIGTSGFVDDSSRTIVEGNLFERCDGEIEIISSKTGNNDIRNNTFLECKGTLTLRHGFSALVHGNFFLGNDRSGSGGVRVIGPGHRIWNNYFERLDARAGGTIGLYAGQPNADDSGYKEMTDVIVAHNTIVDCEGPAFDLAEGLGSSDRTIKPRDVLITANLVSMPGEALAGSSNPDIDWSHNIAYVSGIGTADTSGVTTVSSEPLGPASGGIRRPLQSSGYLDAVPMPQGFVTDDIDGLGRTTPFDIGADEATAGEPINSPLTPEDVGPSWWPTTSSGGDVDVNRAAAFEAEHFDALLDPDNDGTVFLVSSVSGASRGQVLKSPGGSRTDLSGSPHESIAEYLVRFPEPGLFTLYVRARGYNTSSDSFFAPTALDIDPDSSFVVGASGQFEWREGGEYAVAAAGTHFFRIGRREQDAEIDAFVLYPAQGLTDADLAYLLETGVSVPCLGDFDGSGRYDYVDMAVFLSLLAAGDPSSDLTGEGSMNISDVIQMIQLLPQDCVAIQ